MNVSLFRVAMTALFAALIAIGSLIALPIGPVPVVLANFFAILVGLLLGPWWGALSVIVYVAFGLLGLPVFAGGHSGLGYFLGPTGGFIIGYIAAALVAGLIARGWKAGIGTAKSDIAPGIFRLALAGLAALIALYAIGLPWFQAGMATKAPGKYPDLLSAALIFIPYMIGDVAKVVAAVAVSRSLRPLVVRL